MILNCGHVPTEQRPGSVGTGVALMEGYTMCYPCADTDHAASLLWEARVLVYMTSASVTSWTGATLGKILRSKVTRDDHVIIAWVQDLHGQRWIGRGSAHFGNYLKLRRLKGE